MNKNHIGTYGVIKKNGGIDLICSVNYEGGGLFASILKCIDENKGNKKRSNSWYYDDENKFEKIHE